MKVATWNVNSIRTRLERTLRWLEKEAPDVLCLQELKTLDENFPFEALSQAGYHAAVYGQKTYNGVAILSRSEAREVERGFGDSVDDPQARLISARVEGVRVISIYVPNGSEVGSEKYAYKLDWMRRLVDYLERSCDPREALLLCGDFNVAPDDSDVAQPEQWKERVLCHPDVRDAHRRILDWGLLDSFRLHHPEGGIYTWWDYRRLGFPRNNGLRIDHIFVTEPASRRCVSAAVDRDERKGKQPSDHAPLHITLAD